MKCPLLLAAELTEMSAGQSNESDCLQEKCAWWEETQGMCAVKQLQRNLGYLDLTIEGYIEKLSRR